MKTGIHPRYVMSQVSCACGNTFVTRSTKPVIKLEICAACHPFFTGKQKLMDTAGRVERFQKRYASTGGKMVVRKPRKATAPRAAASKLKVLTTAPRKTAAKAKTAKTEKAKAEKKS